ncbi:Hypothetical protein PMT_2316 [Prochlorococcus marinus str. MIT 9313]|uniref:Uncharacterized protein n=1 Tax=Prochlorococcus marinus (strain MIT 9313) TaxID=74547 RepID=B9ERE8_PROMM|nr:Hypothetical protein PMT_2316 [Prochlorococcus marinus str. MIT 9313]
MIESSKFSLAKIMQKPASVGFKQKHVRPKTQFMGVFNYFWRTTSEYQFKIMILMKLIFTYDPDRK